MIKSKVAVLMPVFNGEKYLHSSIRSILDQTYTNWVTIIVNDGSTDGTQEILNGLTMGDSRFFVINEEKNRGRGYARKIALSKALSLDVDYICMLDADDLYYPDKLEWQVSYMDSHKSISLCSCSIGYIDEGKNLIGVLEITKNEKELLFDHYNNYIEIPHACSIIRASSIGDISFNENLLLGQDQDFMIRLLIHKRYSYVPRIGYLYNREASFSFKKYRQSIHYRYLSRKYLGVKGWGRIKLLLQNKIKILIVGVLVLFGREDFYLKRIGRMPNKRELEFHSERF